MLPEDEEVTEHVYADARIIYSNFTTMNDKDGEYDEEMSNAVE